MNADPIDLESQVEHFALLEELRMKHAAFKQEGKQTITTTSGAEKPASEAPCSQPMSMHDAMRAKRVKAGIPSTKTEETSVAVPVSPPASASAPLELQSGSSPAGGGVSLNNWMPQGTTAAHNNTPQSARQQAPSQAEPAAAAALKPGAEPPSSTGGAIATDAHPGRYGDDVLGYGSDADEDVGQFTDVEEDLLAGRLQQQPASVSSSTLESWRARFAANSEEVRLERHFSFAGNGVNFTLDDTVSAASESSFWSNASSASQIVALEAVASSCTQDDLEEEGAIACLVGRSGRYVLRRSTVLLGRGSEAKGGVDVDLSREGMCACTAGGCAPLFPDVLLYFFRIWTFAWF